MVTLCQLPRKRCLSHRTASVRGPRHFALERWKTAALGRIRKAAPHGRLIDIEACWRLLANAQNIRTER